MCRQEGWLAFAWLPDRPLSEAISDPELDFNSVATAGAALAALHAQDPDGLPCRMRSAEAAALRGEATWLGCVFPPLAGRAADLTRRLAARLTQESPLDRPIHGDFHARQVLLGDGTATILDLDQAVRGDPAADLGNFVAHLEREVVRGNLPPNRVEPLRESLLDGYRAATRRPLPARVELYTAMGLVGLALRFFRYCELNWPERAEAILERPQGSIDSNSIYLSSVSRGLSDVSGVVALGDLAPGAPSGAVGSNVPGTCG